MLETGRASLRDVGRGLASRNCGFEKSSVAKYLGIGDEQGYLISSLQNFQPQRVCAIFWVNLCPDAAEVGGGCGGVQRLSTRRSLVWRLSRSTLRWNLFSWSRIWLVYNHMSKL